MLRGESHSAEARAKISAARKGKALSESHRKAISEGRRRMGLATTVWFVDGHGRWFVMGRCMDRKSRGYQWARVLMENHLGRELPATEVVHHINGDCSDDRLENLELLTPSEHAKRHLRPFSDADRLLAGQRIREQKAAQTHCVHGHPFAGDNVRLDTSGKRVCRTCKRERSRRYREGNR